jgi:hypothetical protein
MIQPKKAYCSTDNNLQYIKYIKNLEMNKPNLGTGEDSIGLNSQSC